MKHLILVSAFVFSAVAFAKAGDNDHLWLCEAKGATLDGQHARVKGQPMFYKKDAQKSALQACDSAGMSDCKVKFCVMRSY